VLSVHLAPFCSLAASLRSHAAINGGWAETEAARNHIVRIDVLRFFWLNHVSIQAHPLFSLFPSSTPSPYRLNASPLNRFPLSRVLATLDSTFYFSQGAVGGSHPSSKTKIIKVKVVNMKIHTKQVMIFYSLLRYKLII